MTHPWTRGKLGHTLKQAARNRISTLMVGARFVATAGVILYGIAGIWVGLAQQRTGLRADAIDCAYRVQLIRDRAVALTERSPQQSLGDPQEDVVSTLIRETLEACAAKDAESTKELEAIDARFREDRRLRAQEAEVRRDLLAL